MRPTHHPLEQPNKGGVFNLGLRCSGLSVMHTCARITVAAGFGLLPLMAHLRLAFVLIKSSATTWSELVLSRGIGVCQGS